MNGIMLSAWMLWLAQTSKDERFYGLGMDALVTVNSWNTNGIMVWAWMLWLAQSSKDERIYCLGMDALECMLLEHERNHGLSMDFLVSAINHSKIKR